jgi:hypothetical protein
LDIRITIERHTCVAPPEFDENECDKYLHSIFDEILDLFHEINYQEAKDY